MCHIDPGQTLPKPSAVRCRTLLTTEEGLLNLNRNPDLTKEQGVEFRLP